MRRSLALFAALAFLAGCSAPAEMGTMMEAEDPTVEVIILQLNDVYEITPVSGDREGGLARVATIRNRLLAENPNVITVMAGDFFSPSALGTARVDGERLAGKQMVASLNALGLDVATYGNHEFDLDEEDFLKRIEESDFPYVSANVRTASGGLFPNQRETWVQTFTDADGDAVTIGITGVVLDSNPVDYVQYAPAHEAMEEAVASMDADVILGLTHLALGDDTRIAAEIPEVDLVMGGHEHENVEVYRGSDFTPVRKADANARSVYVHRLRYNPDTDDLDIESDLVLVNSSIPDDPEVAAEVDAWVQTAFRGFRESGFTPEDQVTVTRDALDGRESAIRNRQTLLGTLIAESFYREAEGVDGALFNGGSVRIDDVLAPGPISQYDVIRVLPFGGAVVTVELPGELLLRALDQGEANAGTGGYLQRHNIEPTESGWTIGGAPIDPARTYTIATNDFLVTGYETGLDYFSVENNPDLTQTGELRDVRMAMIDELKRRYD